MPERQTCGACRFWNGGYRLQGMRVPASCSKHFHTQPGNDPACKDFAKREDE